MEILTFDPFQPVALDDPSSVKPDDWLDGLGALLQVDYGDRLSGRIAPATPTVVHFKPQVGVPNVLRGIANGRSLTVSCTLPESDDRALPKAKSHAEA